MKVKGIRRLDIIVNGEVYLTRWYLLRTPWFSVLLHRINKSDSDRALHDHPWPFITIPLRRGYWEHRVQGTTSLKPLRAYYRPATWSHRVELIDGKPAWTLVVHGKRCRKWGFWDERGFTEAKDQSVL